MNNAILMTTAGDAARAIQFNLLIAWIWILLGFLSGAVLGTQFHREDWLGGYGSFKRRLYRLGHISFLGLAAMNLLFYFTAQSAPLDPATMLWASRGFIVGAFTMPLCCAVMAHFPKTRHLFAVPVVSLVAASALTVWGIVQTLNRSSEVERAPGARLSRAAARWKDESVANFWTAPACSIHCGSGDPRSGGKAASMFVPKEVA